MGDIGGDLILFDFLHDGVELFLGDLLADDPLDKLFPALYGVGKAWSFLDDDDILFCEGGVLEGLVFFENLDDFFHKICY